jgi:NAD(P)-dependent dehydrogenase (short-subunit alcohol dehydrogenase family)
MLNVGSISGFVSNFRQNHVACNSSKAAVRMMTTKLASEFAAAGTRVNAVAPGYINTEMSRGGIANPEWFPTWRDMTPKGPVGEPDEVACALFLCSSAASYATSDMPVVDGGCLTRLACSITGCSGEIGSVAFVLASDPASLHRAN